MANTPARASAQSACTSSEDQFSAIAAKVDNLIEAAKALADKITDERQGEAFHTLFWCIGNGLDELEAIAFPPTGKQAAEDTPEPESEAEPQLGPIDAELRDTLIERNARVCDLAMYLLRELDDKDSLKSLARALDRELFEFSELLYGNKLEQAGGRDHD